MTTTYKFNSNPVDMSLQLPETTGFKVKQGVILSIAAFAVTNDRIFIADSYEVLTCAIFSL
jgi:hypothetical protein